MGECAGADTVVDAEAAEDAQGVGGEANDSATAGGAARAGGRVEVAFVEGEGDGVGVEGEGEGETLCAGRYVNYGVLSRSCKCRGKCRCVTETGVSQYVVDGTTVQEFSISSAQQPGISHLHDNVQPRHSTKARRCG